MIGQRAEFFTGKFCIDKIDNFLRFQIPSTPTETKAIEKYPLRVARVFFVLEATQRKA
jgi:hypothetical protein